MNALARRSLIRSCTTARRPPLCPEIQLLHNSDFEGLWLGLQAIPGTVAATPPYWAHAWPGGQALARYLLDHPGLVRGRRVLDVGCGGGLCAIAAALAGAAHVQAVDNDPWAVQATILNAELNQVALTTTLANLIDATGEPELVLAADLWYDRFLAQQVTARLTAWANAGTQVLLGDSARAYFPRSGTELLASYELASDPAFDPPGPLLGRAYGFRPR